jgi:signal transduction histidine kinase
MDMLSLKGCFRKGSFFYLNTIVIVFLYWLSINGFVSANPQFKTSKKLKTEAYRTEISKVDDLNNKANEVLKENYAEALQLAQTAVLNAKNINYKAGEIESKLIECIVYINTNKSKKAYDLLMNIKTEKEVLNNVYLNAKTLFTLGFYYYSTGQYDLAIKYFEDEIELLKNVNNFNLLYNANIHLGKTYIKIGNLQEAKFYHENAIQIAKKSSIVDFPKQHDLLGEIFHAQKLFEAALESYYKGLKANYRSKDRQLNSSIYLHLGNTYYMLVQDDSAQHYYQLALNNFQLLGDSTGIAICYSNLSRVYLELGKYKASIDFALKAINTIHDGDYKPIELGTLQQLGDIYGELGEYKNADLYLKKALQLAVQYHQKLAETDCLKSLSEIAKLQGNHEQSYYYLIQAYHLKDSLQPLTFNKQLAEMQTKYETEKKEKEIAKLNQIKINNQLKLAEQYLQVQKRNYIIAGVTLMTLIISIAGYIFFKLYKDKQAKINEHNLLQQQHEERQRIAKDLHDEIGSGLSKITLLSALSNQNEINIPYALKTINQTAQNVIENMRDFIWTLKSENINLETLTVHLREYAADYLEEFPLKLSLNFQDKFNQTLNITKEKQHHILMCYKETLNNLVKHAQATIVIINVSIIENILCINIIDDGIGFEMAHHFNDEKNGLKNMKNRMEAIGGVFEIVSHVNKGTSITMSVKLI